MHLNRYLIPAMVAAAIHVSLAMFSPVRDQPRIGRDKEPVPAAPKPPVAEIEVPLDPPEDAVVAPGHLDHSDTPAPPEINPLPNNSPITMPTTDVVSIDPIRTDHLTNELPASPFGSAGPIGVPGIFRPGDLDNVPRALSQVSPTYPHEMQTAGLGGTVTVEFTVDATGRVVSATAVASTRPDFEGAAVRAVLRWRFEPGRRHGRAVPFRMAIPISFKATNA